MEELTDRQKAIRSGMSAAEINVRNTLSRAHENVAPILRRLGTDMPADLEDLNAYAGLPAFEFAASQRSHLLMAALDGACAQALKESSLSKEELASLLQQRESACRYVQLLNKEIKRYRETLAALNAFSDSAPSGHGSYSC